MNDNYFSVTGPPSDTPAPTISQVGNATTALDDSHSKYAIICQSLLLKRLRSNSLETVTNSVFD